MDISDLDAQPIINGIALVTGTDRFSQYEYLNFAGELLVISDYQIDAVPTWDSLGASGHVYFVPNANRPAAEPIDPWNFVSPRYMIDAPSDGHLWGRRNSMWQRLVALAGDTMTGTLTLKPDANQPTDEMEATGAEYINIRDGGVFY